MKPAPQTQPRLHTTHAAGPWRLAIGAMVLALCGCANGPTQPAWRADAKEAVERAQAAFLAGDTRIALAEMARARQAVSSTGRPDWMAQAELAFCAAQAASLELTDCPGFEALRADATPLQRAYADYLRGRSTPQGAELLAPWQQAITRQQGGDANGLKALQAQAEPLSRLLGAAVLLQRGQADPAVVELAVDTASTQGWRRPLLAWLGVQLLSAEQAGQTELADRIRRRIQAAQGRVEASR